MSEKYLFFDSTLDDPREYPASSFAEYFSKLLTSGVFNGGSELQVSCSGDSMNTYIVPGYAWIKGYLYKLDASNLVLAHSAADSSNNRIDRIVIRLDTRIENRFVKAFVIEGTPAGTPLAPALTRNENIYEISLAKVLIIAGKSYIEAAEITDERLDESVCGLVNSLIQVDTSTMQAEFDDFMAQLESMQYVNEEDFTNHESSIVAHGFETHIEIDALESILSGNKKADASCWGEQCVYASTPISGTTELTNGLITNLRYCKYSLAIRLKSANNSLSTDAIKVDIQKNVSGSFTSISSRLIKANEFLNTTDYQVFYLLFDYKAPKAQSNQLKLVVTLQTQASAYEVDLDSVIIQPVGIGLFYIS